MAECDRCVKSDVCRNYVPRSAAPCSHYLPYSQYLATVTHGKLIKERQPRRYTCSVCGVWIWIGDEKMSDKHNLELAASLKYCSKCGSIWDTIEVRGGEDE